MVAKPSKIYFWFLFFWTFCSSQKKNWNFQGCITVYLSRYCLIMILTDCVRQRRRRDLNPRAAINDLHPFQGCLFNHLSTSAKRLIHRSYSNELRSNLLINSGRCILSYAALWLQAERKGFEPLWRCRQTVFKTASLWPLRYRSELTYHYVSDKITLCLSCCGISRSARFILTKQGVDVNYIF